MRTIRNNSARPLVVPLPHGKTLHLGPGKSGQIRFQAVDHPPLRKMVEEGDLEILGEEAGRSGGSTEPGKEPVHESTHGHLPEMTSRQSGNR